MSDRSLRATRLGLVILGIAGAAVVATPAPAQVRLDLRIPSAETYVIGDAIPLYWRFSNQSTQTLAFMWEGCCRLNGKLVVSQAGHPLPVAPPGQALAHMFAKADRLEPGVPKEYDTKVSDWVALPGTGRYDLRGTYRGVLPTQFPQVQRGLALWRDSADSPSVNLEVLGVDDYLRQREQREQRRGLRVRLVGPPELPPLLPITFQVTLENTSSSTQSVTWPDEEALWVLDRHGHRVAPAAVIQGPTETLSIPPGGRLQHEFALSSDRFEGEPLGDYRLFVDLAEGQGDSHRPRVPSNEIPLRWQLSDPQVVDLVNAAAQGAGTGARNAPLKLLRVYLGDLAETFARLDPAKLEAAARPLAGRLAEAARLKPLAPKPGLFEARLFVPANPATAIAWRPARMAEVLGAAGSDPASQLAALLALRRHLGWEVSLALEPEDSTAVGRLFDAVDQFSTQTSELAGPAALLIETGGTNAPVRLQLAGAPRAGAPVLRFTATGLDWSRDGRAFERVADRSTLKARLSSVSGGTGVAVTAETTLPWQRLKPVLAEVLAPGSRLDLSLLSSPGG